MKISIKYTIFLLIVLLAFSCSLSENENRIDSGNKTDYKELYSTINLTGDDVISNMNYGSSRDINSDWQKSVSVYFSIVYGKDVITWNQHLTASYYLVYAKMGSLWTNPTRFERTDPLNCHADPVYDGYYVRACNTYGSEITGKYVVAP